MLKNFNHLAQNCEWELRRWTAAGRAAAGHLPSHGRKPHFKQPTKQKSCSPCFFGHLSSCSTMSDASLFGWSLWDGEIWGKWAFELFEILESPGRTLGSMEAIRASVGSHQPKVCSVPTLFREQEARKSLLVWSKKYSFQTCFLTHLLKRVHQLKG